MIDNELLSLDHVPPFCRECGCGGDWHYKLCTVGDRRGDTHRLMRPFAFAARFSQCTSQDADGVRGLAGKP